MKKFLAPKEKVEMTPLDVAQGMWHNGPRNVAHEMWSNALLSMFKRSEIIVFIPKI